MVPLGTAMVAVLASESSLAKLSEVDRSIVLYVAERRLFEETFATATMEQSYLAKMSTNKNIGTFNYLWNDNFAMATYFQTRPYDDCSILVYDVEINFSEEMAFELKTKGTTFPE